MNNNTVVVDANIAAKLAIAEYDSDKAIALFREWKAQNIMILVPALFIYEITNILLKQVRRKQMTIEEAKKATLDIMDTDINIYWPVDPEMSISALALAHTYKLPATYDAHYLALAEREQCEFWTADARLYNSVREQLAWVRLMADNPAASTSA